MSLLTACKELMFVLVYFSSVCSGVDSTHLIVDTADVSSCEFGAFLNQTCQLCIVGPYGTRQRRYIYIYIYIYYFCYRQRLANMLRLSWEI